MQKQPSILSSEIIIGDAARARFLGNYLVLRREAYDSRQYWLPFVQTIIITEDTATEPARKHDAPTLKGLDRSWSKGTRIQPPWATRILFQYERDVPQMTLPFKEGQSVSNGDFVRLSAADFPAFERNADGEVAYVRHDGSITTRDRLREWCHENCLGRYAIRPGGVYFELWHDAVLMKVAFA